MKKSFLLLAGLIMLGTVAQAQVSLIPKAGVVFSNVNLDDDLVGQESRTGFTAGLGVNFPLTSDAFFSIQPELLYVQQGFRSTIGDFDFDYLQLPLLLKVNFGMENLPIYVNAGPTFGYLFNDPVDIGDVRFGDPNRLDIGLAFGGGLGLGVGPGNLLLDARYSFGLTDIRNFDGEPDSFNRSKNNVFMVTLGYAIPLGGE